MKIGCNGPNAPKPSSPSRTRGCSTNCASALRTSLRRWSSRRQRRRCCALSQALPVICSRCLRQCWRMQFASATQTFGNIYRWDGEALHHLVAHNTPIAFAEARKRSPRHPAPNTPADRAVATKTVVHVADLAAEQAYVEQRDPATVAAVELGGVRTFRLSPC